MMMRIFLGAVLLGASPLGAQTVRLGIATGVVMPFGSVFSQGGLGWHVLGAVQTGSPRSSFSVRVDAIHGETSNGSYVTRRLTGGTVNLLYYPEPPRRTRGYLLAGLGLHHVWHAALPDINPASQTQIAYDAGAGVSVGMKPTRFFGEARYLTVRNSYYYGPTNVVLVTAGVSFGK